MFSARIHYADILFFSPVMHREETTESSYIALISYIRPGTGSRIVSLGLEAGCCVVHYCITNSL